MPVTLKLNDMFYSNLKYEMKSSVSARKTKQYVSIGLEMVNCFKNKQPIPKVVDRNAMEGASERRIARIIDHMTKLFSRERKNINETEAEYQGIL